MRKGVKMSLTKKERKTKNRNRIAKKTRSEQQKAKIYRKHT